MHPSEGEHITRPSSRLRRALESAGGFTFHRHTGEPLYDGVSVCADPRATFTFPLEEWDDDRVSKWIRWCVERVRDSDLHLGGWLDPATGWVALDVVRVYPSHQRGEALHLGRAHQQTAVFDLGQGCAVRLASPFPVA